MAAVCWRSHSSSPLSLFTSASPEDFWVCCFDLDLKLKVRFSWLHRPTFEIFFYFFILCSKLYVMKSLRYEKSICTLTYICYCHWWNKALQLQDTHSSTRLGKLERTGSVVQPKPSKRDFTCSWEGYPGFQQPKASQMLQYFDWQWEKEQKKI